MIDKLLITNHILPYLTDRDIVSVKQAFGIDSVTLLSEIKNLDPNFNLILIYQNAIKYNMLKGSISWRLRDMIKYIDQNRSPYYQNIQPYVKLEPNNVSSFSDIKLLLKGFTIIEETEKHIKYTHNNEWDLIYRNIRWLDLYENQWKINKMDTIDLNTFDNQHWPKTFP